MQRILTNIRKYASKKAMVAIAVLSASMIGFFADVSGLWQLYSQACDNKSVITEAGNLLAAGRYTELIDAANLKLKGCDEDAFNYYRGMALLNSQTIDGGKWESHLYRVNVDSIFYFSATAKIFNIHAVNDNYSGLVELYEKFRADGYKGSLRYLVVSLLYLVDQNANDQRIRTETSNYNTWLKSIKNITHTSNLIDLKKGVHIDISLNELMTYQVSASIYEAAMALYYSNHCNFELHSIHSTIAAESASIVKPINERPFGISTQSIVTNVIGIASNVLAKCPGAPAQ